MLYSLSDVFVFSSIMEAFGKTIIESMACGTPVVVLNSTGPKDIIKHKIDGYCAIPHDTQDLINGIDWVANNSNYKELSIKVRTKAIKEFDKSISAKKYIKLYNKLLSN